MADIHSIPDALKHDIIAMYIRRLGVFNPDAPLFHGKVEGEPRDLLMTELRIPLVEHEALPQHFVLDVYLDRKTNELVLSYAALGVS